MVTIRYFVQFKYISYRQYEFGKCIQIQQNRSENGSQGCFSLFLFATLKVTGGWLQEIFANYLPLKKKKKASEISETGINIKTDIYRNKTTSLFDKDFK